MNDSMQRSHLLPIVAGVYFGTCFVTAVVWCGVLILIAPPAYSLAAKTWMASFFIQGFITAGCCTGGVLGIWLITASIDRPTSDHIKTAVLIGLVATAILIEFSIGKDRLMLGAMFVTVLSAVIALIVKTYTHKPSSTRPIV